MVGTKEREREHSAGSARTYLPTPESRLAGLITLPASHVALGEVLADELYGIATASASPRTYIVRCGRPEPDAAFVDFRTRDLNHTLSGWMERDPAGYVDGANTYQFELSQPIEVVDAMGLDAGPSSSPTSRPGAIDIREVTGDDFSFDSPGFIGDFVDGTAWAVTTFDTDHSWEDLHNGTWLYKGSILTRIRTLTVPKCVKDASQRAKVQTAVNAFNKAA